MTDTDCCHEFSYWSHGVRICLACEAALEHKAPTTDANLLARDVEKAWDNEPTPFNRADVAVRVVLSHVGSPKQ